MRDSTTVVTCRGFTPLCCGELSLKCGKWNNLQPGFLNVPVGKSAWKCLCNLTSVDFAVSQIFCEVHRVKKKKIMHIVTECLGWDSLELTHTSGLRLTDWHRQMFVAGPQSSTASTAWTAGKHAHCSCFVPMYTNYTHLNRSYGRTFCTESKTYLIPSTSSQLSK